MRIANQERAEQKAREIPHRIEKVGMTGRGPVFEVSFDRQIWLEDSRIGATGGVVRFHRPAAVERTYRVRWNGMMARDWRNAECDCEWGQKNGRGCWHVAAIRLEWMRRDAERHEQLKAACAT